MGKGLSQHDETRLIILLNNKGWLKVLGICGLGKYGLGLIFSIRLNGRKGIQPIKSAWSICSHSLKDCVVLPLEENNKGNNMNIHPILKHIQYEIQHFGLIVENLKNYRLKIKHKLPKTGSKMTFISHVYLLLMNVST